MCIGREEGVDLLERDGEERLLRLLKTEGRGAAALVGTHCFTRTDGVEFLSCMSLRSVL